MAKEKDEWGGNKGEPWRESRRGGRGGGRAGGKGGRGVWRGGGQTLLHHNFSSAAGGRGGGGDSLVFTLYQTTSQLALCVLQNIKLRLNSL